MADKIVEIKKQIKQVAVPKKIAKNEKTDEELLIEKEIENNIDVLSKDDISIEDSSDSEGNSNSTIEIAIENNTEKQFEENEWEERIKYNKKRILTNMVKISNATSKEEIEYINDYLEIELKNETENIDEFYSIGGIIPSCMSTSMALATAIFFGTEEIYQEVNEMGFAIVTGENNTLYLATLIGEGKILLPVIDGEEDRQCYVWLSQNGLILSPSDTDRWANIFLSFTEVEVKLLNGSLNFFDINLVDTVYLIKKFYEIFIQKWDKYRIIENIANTLSNITKIDNLDMDYFFGEEKIKFLKIITIQRRMKEYYSEELYSRWNYEEIKSFWLTETLPLKFEMLYPLVLD